MKKGTEVTVDGITFIVGISKKFDKDLRRATEILAKENKTAEERAELLSIYAPAFHTDGKIEDITSCDSSCNGCQFCQRMLEAAREDIRIICGLCYDEAQEKYKLHSRNRHSLNMLIMSKVEFTEEELARLPLTGIVRINSSGDTPNATYARNMLRIAFAHDGCKVGYWAKHTAPIVQACDELGKPNNLRLIQSSIFIGKPAKLARYFDNSFTVYPDEDTCSVAIANGASPCNGMKCKACGFKCYTGEHDGVDIAEVLRGANKELRKKIINLTE